MRITATIFALVLSMAAFSKGITCQVEIEMSGEFGGMFTRDLVLQSQPNGLYKFSIGTSTYYSALTCSDIFQGPFTCTEGDLQVKFSDNLFKIRTEKNYGDSGSWSTQSYQCINEPKLFQ